jgi:hypothetical protein
MENLGFLEMRLMRYPENVSNAERTRPLLLAARSVSGISSAAGHTVVSETIASTMITVRDPASR